MADKHLILGATYNGDGTSTAEAASDGAAGAWNQQSILTGTAPVYGAISSSDVVHIRSKTSAGANITITLTAATTFGNSGAAFVLDNGAKWPGVDGNLLVNATATAYCSFGTGTFIAARDHAWRVYYSPWTSTSANFFRVNTSAKVIGVHCDQSSRTAAGSVQRPLIYGYCERCKFTLPLISTVAQGSFLFANDYRAQLVNCTFELPSTTSGGTLFIVQGNANNVVLVDIIGGEVIGAGVAYNSLTAADDGAIRITGLKVPKTMPLGGFTSGAFKGSTVDITMLDGDFGAFKSRYWGYFDSRLDVNYPTLNATLPGTGVAWSYKMRVGATSYGPADLSIAKIYVDPPAAKTITLNLLIEENYAPADDQYASWITVQYTDDTTGKVRFLSTQAYAVGTPLDTSTAGWSSTAYGAYSYVKRKIEVITPTAIKQNTTVLVTFFCQGLSADATQLMFICPDVQLS